MGVLSGRDRRAYLALLREVSGYYGGGDLAYGLRVDQQGQVVEDPNEQRAIARICDLYAKGLPPRWIIDYLKVEGICARNGTTDWHVTTIRRIAPG
jgi:hypothetical protein